MRKSTTARLAALRAEAAWKCVSVLAPDLKGEAKMEMARKVLTVVDGKDRPQPRSPVQQITPAQVETIVWANMQCINPNCPMLLYSKQIADEVNDLFNPEE